MSKINEGMFDVRHIDRYLAEKALTSADVEAHLASLEDCAENVEQSSIQMVAHDRHRRVVFSEEGAPDEDEG